MGGDKSAREGADVHGRLIPLGGCRSSPALKNIKFSIGANVPRRRRGLQNICFV